MPRLRVFRRTPAAPSRPGAERGEQLAELALGDVGRCVRAAARAGLTGAALSAAPDLARAATAFPPGAGCPRIEGRPRVARCGARTALDETTASKNLALCRRDIPAAPRPGKPCAACSYVFETRFERLVEVGPQVVHVLEPDGQPDEVGGHAVALPAGARLEHALDAAEARRVADQRRRALELLGRLAPVGDEERQQAAERRQVAGRDGIAEAGVEDPLDAGCASSRRASSSALADWRSTRTASVRRPRSSSHAGSGAATTPVRVRNS